MSEYIQVSEDRFFKKDSCVDISLGKGVLWIDDFPVSGHYATIARKELGLDRLAEENAMTIQCLEAIDKFVAWWREQEGTLFADAGRHHLIVEQLSLIPPSPVDVVPTVLEEIGRETIHSKNYGVVLVWRQGKWCVSHAYQNANSPFWYWLSEIVSYVHPD